MQECIQWQMSTSMKVANSFFLAITVSEILTFQTFDLEKFSQDYRVTTSAVMPLVGGLLIISHIKVIASSYRFGDVKV